MYGVRLWDDTSGSLLDTCNVGAQVELLHSNGQEEAILPAVTDFGAMPDGSVFAVALQRSNAAKMQSFYKNSLCCQSQ
ncbi:tRNA (guanine-N(7)-)-methyltransferase non-catalytic subunit wdr4 [Olea europaea subsp. europaea]|uniref:tRNA (Guanine-N(7)-)-methyltransferase non-catalytic subunit wdr4 n=1 Tax=Olea europaea subsp. europaea TaxID=158383 RepID=A0A8S0PXV2_OLEEU|nr:tRNA (guanine-N(7)-)-methyltransferase non-catalytic subunit wdr4 [Olea europaea subsp. europaea]